MIHPDFRNLLEQAVALRNGRVCGRYAPSPSGPLHLGNLQTALLAWLHARLSGGVFIMRMEDLDRPRVRAESAGRILEDLRWLGLDWDEGPDVGGPTGPYDQSARIEIYRTVFEQLREENRLFPCYCSRKDIAQAASAPHGSGTAIYPGTCRRRRVLREGRSPSWRYRVPEREVRFQDRIMGTYSQSLHREVGDFVLQRGDGIFAYQLAVVTDDALMGVTDVVRGADLLDSTPRQIELFEALGFPVPSFWHTPLVLDEQGRRLAKRQGDDSVAVFRERGTTAPMLVGQIAAALGLVPPGTHLTADELLNRLTIAEFRAALKAQSVKR